jgi:hypothetical protein
MTRHARHRTGANRQERASREESPLTDPRATAGQVPRLRNGLAASVGWLYLALSCLNLFYPSPKGPADNGDFARIFASFSTGPLGFEFWPSPADPARYQMRFFNYFHRFWRLDGAVTGRAWKSSSSLVFLPARLIRPATGYFDLAFNSLALVLLIAGLTFFTLRSIRSVAPFAALAALILLMSDLDIVDFLSSFFTESGAYVYLIFLLCFLFRYWQDGRMPDYAGAILCGILLSTTRIAYAPAVLPAIAPVLFFALRIRKERAAAWKISLTSAALLLAAAALFFPSPPAVTQRENAYHFIFGGALPRLADGERPGYLGAVDINERFASLSGKNAYRSDSEIRDPELSPRLNRTTQVRAIVELLGKHPRAFFDLIGWSFSTAGFYPAQSKPGILAKNEPQASVSWHGWSAFRNGSFHGLWSYGAAILLLGGVGLVARRAGAGSWPVFFFLCGAGFFVASVAEVLISVLGNGPFDIRRHNYLANLLLDCQILFSIAGIAMMRRRTALPSVS